MNIDTMPAWKDFLLRCSGQHADCLERVLEFATRKHGDEVRRETDAPRLDGGFAIRDRVITPSATWVVESRLDGDRFVTQAMETQ